MIRFQLFTDVRSYYTDLHTSLQKAQETIHMASYAYDAGVWAEAIGHTLAQKAASGVSVHLLVDEAGLYLENLRHGIPNRHLLAHLQASGVQVDLFRPHGRRLSQFNRLHCKFCAIDGQTAFIGGSNIGDHYLDWRDSNLRLDGLLGEGFVHLYNGLRFFSGHPKSQPLKGGELQVAEVPLLLTVPGRRQDIRRALLDLILSADTAVTLRSWYFLPDQEIMNALLTQAEEGVQVTILFSHRTRVPLIDWANHWLEKQLVASGVQVHRYHTGYMHAKEAWNNHGDILFGSANIDRWALSTNFECCLRVTDRHLAKQLTSALQADMGNCLVSPQKSSSTIPSLVLTTT